MPSDAWIIITRRELTFFFNYYSACRDQASWDDPFPFVDPKFKMYEHIR